MARLGTSMKLLRFVAPTALALALSLSYGNFAHAQADNCGGTCTSTQSCEGGSSGSGGVCVETFTGSNGSTGGVTNSSSNAGAINVAQFQDYKDSILTIINGILVPVLVAVAFIVFIWGVFNYFIRGAAEPDKRKEGAQYVLWAVVGFVIIFSVWGLVNLLMGTLNLTSGSLHPGYPTL